MRRSGVGLAALDRQNKAREQYRQAATALATSQFESMETFKSHLQQFAVKYQKDIRQDPRFRAQFQQMCSRIGVDPLASNKGFWAEILGVGDFYYELAVQIVEYCLASRHRNGGYMDLMELKDYLNRQRTFTSDTFAIDPPSSSQQEQEVVSEDDVARAIKCLKSLGSGFELLTIGGRRLVQSVPRELSVDNSKVMELAASSRCGPFITEGALIEDLNWTKERADRSLTELLQQGICWVDKQTDPVHYWFPSLFLIISQQPD